MQVKGAAEDELVEISHQLMHEGVIVEEKHGQVKTLTMGAVDMMDPQGNISAVALQCGHRNNLKAASREYESQTKLINLSHGFIPVRECPHTYAYSAQLHGDGPRQPLVALPKDATAAEIAEIAQCPGNRCKHFETVREARLAASLAEYEKHNKKNNGMVSLDDFERMAKLLGANAAPKAGRAG